MRLRQIIAEFHRPGRDRVAAYRALGAEFAFDEDGIPRIIANCEAVWNSAGETPPEFAGDARPELAGKLQDFLASGADGFPVECYAGRWNHLYRHRRAWITDAKRLRGPAGGLDLRKAAQSVCNRCLSA